MKGNLNFGNCLKVLAAKHGVATEIVAVTVGPTAPATRKNETRFATLLFSVRFVKDLLCLVRARPAMRTVRVSARVDFTPTRRYGA